MESPPKPYKMQKKIETARPRRYFEQGESDVPKFPQNRKGKQKREQDPSVDERTIFVGNLPNTIQIKALRQMFTICGSVESVRLRSAAPATLNLPKKAIVIKRDFHEQRRNINAYVVFVKKKSVTEALKFNGRDVQGMHIRVDIVRKDQKHDNKKSVFVGNLPFDVDEEAVREHFADCGTVENVRIIRDTRTGVGKGFGYVLFKEKDAVELALKLNDQILLNRRLRVSHCVEPLKQSKQKAAPRKAAAQGPEGADEYKRKFTSRNRPSNMAPNTYQGMKAQKMKKARSKKFKKKQNTKKLTKKLKSH